MEAERWREIDELLCEVLHVPADQRTAWLSAQCETDPHLREQVASFLSQYDGLDGFLDTRSVCACSSELNCDDGWLRGRMLGSYRILDVIGRGGMGAVYLAERADDTFCKNVAIKVAGTGPLAASFLRRFRREQRILASLEHPNIARMMDAGVTSDGVHYVVLEYIDGLPLTEHCEANRLSQSQRIRLFQQVCSAVQCAHQNLIVHRDLKPSNILVTREGVPKLIDFGIARRTGAEAQTGGTVTNEIAFTPEYASPEQVRGSTIGTASDIYSLGVVLHELLRGRRPYEIEQHSIEDLWNKVVLSEATEAGLGDDLDAIISKTLRKDATERYSSPAALSEDLDRFLGGYPVHAKEGRFWYRSRKFAYRNRIYLTTAVVITAVLTASGAAVLRHRATAESERLRATVNERAAREERRLAEESRAMAARQQAMAAEERRILEMQRRLANRTAAEAIRERELVEADRRRRLADIRSMSRILLFDVHEAVVNVPRSLELRRNILRWATEYLDSVAGTGNDVQVDVELAIAYRKLAELSYGGSAVHLGDRAAALNAYAKSRTLLETSLAGGAWQPHVVRQLAEVLHDASLIAEPEGALPLAEQALSLSREWVRRDPHDVEARRLLARTVTAPPVARVRMKGSREELNAAKAEQVRLYDELLADFPSDTRILWSLAFALRNWSTPEAAGRALEIDRQLLALNPSGANERLNVSFDLSMLASYAIQRGDKVQAISLLDECIALRRALLEENPQNASARSRLAYSLALLAWTGGPEPAEALRETLALIQPLPNDSVHPSVSVMAAETLLRLSDQSASADVTCEWHRAGRLMPATLKGNSQAGLTKLIAVCSQ